jgi:tetratricopeptide (TPR) repeat protein/transcriptional regulator with XRE-family HTH domain
LTQEALGELAGLSGQAVGALERGDRRFPRRDTVLRLADALELSDQERTDFTAAVSTRKGRLGPAAQPDDRYDRPEPARAPISQLPSDIPDFTGRETQIDRLTAKLGQRGQSGPPPLAVVVGGPGIGKSALALHVAHRIAAKFEDGQLYLDLAGTSEPRHPAVMLGEMLYALGVFGAALPDGVPARSALFRSLLADRQVLLVLDDAANSDQIRPLLPPAGACGVLVTSRQLLTDLAGAQHVELDVLPEQEASQLFSGIVGPDRITHEPEHATAILAACAHLPLAIRIAAGRLAGRPAWPLRLLRERLDDESRRLTELRLGDLGVRASFAASVSQLPEAAVLAFRLLGLVGPRTVPGWVLGPLLDRPEADDVLDILVDANLVSLVGIDVNGRPRYRLHDLLRAYADEGAQAIPLDVRARAMNRLLSTWLELVLRATDKLEPSLFRPQRQPAPVPPLPPSTMDNLVADASRWFDAERGALLGAVELAVAWKLDEVAWELAAAAVPYYDQHSLYEDWRRTHELALAAIPATGNPRAEATMLRGLGQILLYRDDYAAASANFQRALTLSQQCGDDREAFLATASLGTIDRVLGRLDQAETRILKSLEIVIAGGDRHLEAQIRSALGKVLLAQGRVDEARAPFEQALEICRKIGDLHREAVVLREACMLYDKVGEPGRAIAYLERALEIFGKIDDERCVAYTMLKAGQLHAGHRDRPRATDALESAVAFFAQHGNRMEEAECWQLLGELDAALDDIPNARQKLGRSLHLWQSIGASEHVAEVEACLGRLS